MYDLINITLWEIQTVTGTIFVPAKSLAEAIEIARDV